MIKKTANVFCVESNNIQYICSSRKKIKGINKIIVGDDVEFVKIDDDYVIERILNRKNSIIRPNVVNVDAIVIVQSVIEPDMNIFQLNKYLAFYELQNIDKIIIYFSKMDLIDNSYLFKINEIISHYEKDGYLCVKSSDVDSIEKVKHLFRKNNVICMVGESGVGKSTLINKLIPNINIKTNEISKVLNRGKHTTTTITLIRYYDGYLVDTPGFGTVDLNISNSELSKCYNDFRKYSENCKFRNCMHKNEINCEIKKQVQNGKIWIERYNSYLKLLENNSKKNR